MDPLQHLTGLVLAGGEGRRLGQEKGLALWQGRPLALRALERLRPQVKTIALNVNRCFDVYAPWGVPLWLDNGIDRPKAQTSQTGQPSQTNQMGLQEGPLKSASASTLISPSSSPSHSSPSPIPLMGPLAGVLAGLLNMQTEWLLTVPCDAPLFPLDLAQQFCSALNAPDAPTARAAFACTAPNGKDKHPVMALIHRDLAPSLAQFLAQGERQVGLWLAQQKALPVVFADPQAFANVNTPSELEAGLTPA